MICRSAVKPVFVGLGTAAILAAGRRIRHRRNPVPSDSGSTTPAVGKLVVAITATPSPDAGDPVDIAATVTADGGTVAGVIVKSIEATPQTATLTGKCVKPYPADACRPSDGDLGSGETANFNWTLKAPKTLKKAQITLVVGATDLEDVARTSTITYIMPTPTKTATPTKSPTKKPTKKPTKSPSPSASSSSSSGTSSGGGSGSGGSSGSSGSGSGGYAGPSPNSSFDARNPQVALPPIQAPSPSVAPSPAPGSGTPQSRLQGNKAPVAQDLTFERMASTQIAWLAALLVAFSLLLTQVRLGRRRQPAGAPRRAKGTHRRPRHGMFGR